MGSVKNQSLTEGIEAHLTLQLILEDLPKKSPELVQAVLHSLSIRLRFTLF